MRLYFEAYPIGAGIILILFRWKQSVSCDLSLCGLTILYGHWQIPYACGNHEPIYDGVCVVGMYVSLLIFLLTRNIVSFHACSHHTAACERTAKVRKSNEKFEAERTNFFEKCPILPVFRLFTPQIQVQGCDWLAKKMGGMVIEIGHIIRCIKGSFTLFTAFFCYFRVLIQIS